MLSSGWMRAGFCLFLIVSALLRASALMCTRCRYIRWSELLRLTFGLTVDKCPACGGRMKLRALVRAPEGIERFLRHENLWSPPPTPSPARAPPYDRSVTRLQPTRQQHLFPDA